MKVKAGQPLIEVLSLAYESNQPVLLVGRHGVGKSELVAAAAKSLEINHIVRDLSLMEPPDLAGLPIVENGKMSYASPEFLPSKGKGLLVFEELNRAPRYLQSPCLQLLTARRLNDYILPKNWLPVACINPCDAGYMTEELDAALASRFLKVEVEADIGEWLKWAGNNEVDERICEYVSTLKSFSGNHSNPRSWTYASRILNTSEKMNSNSDTLLAGLEGIIGAELSLSFLRFIGGTEKPFKSSDIIERYQEIQPTIKRWKQKGLLDLLSASLHRLQTFLQAEMNWRAVQDDKKQLKNVRQFIKDLTGDLRKQATDFFKSHGYILQVSK